ncbi:pre-mRNA polyadenylation factor FIP1-like [Amaranthus tricolor]|uniref:pre-mRNA polyadenylation factor FIP1-like n=1 Tax=Amaranthus tricolor TaxID=29722 RepID=UPI00258F2FDF|nr:pre-mRNA polyadenylation factor FIP1-like [Amaranthus tricolor]
MASFQCNFFVTLLNMIVLIMLSINGIHASRHLLQTTPPQITTPNMPSIPNLPQQPSIPNLPQQPTLPNMPQPSMQVPSLPSNPTAIPGLTLPPNLVQAITSFLQNLPNTLQNAPNNYPFIPYIAPSPSN